MYRRYNGPPDGQYSVCTVEEILDNFFAELVFCGLSCLPPFLHFTFLNSFTLCF